MDWGEPATCVEGYYPVPAYPPEYMCTYDCCATVPDGYDYEEPEDCSAKHGRLQGSCDADDDCVWMAAWNECKDECSNLDEDDCHDHCEYDWDNEVCFTRCDAKYQGVLRRRPTTGAPVRPTTGAPVRPTLAWKRGEIGSL